MTDLELTASPVIYDEDYSVELMIGAEHQTYRAHRDFGPAEHCPNLATEDGYCPGHVDAA